MVRDIKIPLFVLLIIISLFSTANAQIPLVINEFMASNSDFQPDPQGEYDDWIELYNTGGVPIHIGGMYLTDDLSVPNKWQIPESTVVSADGYLLIWTDNDTDDDHR